MTTHYLYSRDSEKRVIALRVVNSRSSKLSPIKTKILIVPGSLLGTHEKHIVNGARSIDFSRGWNGPPIAVGGYTDRIFKSLRKKVTLFKNFKYGDLGVLDGHHRLAAATKKLSLVPVQLFPLENHCLKIGTWRENTAPLNRDKVVSYFKNRHKHAPAKSTKFQVLGTDSKWHRIVKVQPIVQVAYRSLSSI